MQLLRMFWREERNELFALLWIRLAWFGRKEIRQFKDRRALYVILFSSYQGPLSLSFRILSHLWGPFVAQSPPWQANTWDKLGQKPRPHPAPSLGTLLPPLPWNRNTQSFEQNWEFPKGKPHWKFKIGAGECKAKTISFFTHMDMSMSWRNGTRTQIFSLLIQSSLILLLY